MRREEGGVIIHLDTTATTIEWGPILHDIMLIQKAGIFVIPSCHGTKGARYAKCARAYNLNVNILTSANELITMRQQTQATKVLLLCDRDGIFTQHALIHECTPHELNRTLSKATITGNMRLLAETAIKLCGSGVKRVHIINARRDGAILAELLTNKGMGTMICPELVGYKSICKVAQEELDTMATLIKMALNIHVTGQSILQYFPNIWAFTVDGNPHGVLIYSISEQRYMVEYLASSNVFKLQESLGPLLAQVIKEANEEGVTDVFINPKRLPDLITIEPWFLKMGFRRSKKIYRDWWLRNTIT